MSNKKIAVKLLAKKIPYGGNRAIHKLMVDDGISISYERVAAVFRGDTFNQQVFDYGVKYVAMLADQAKENKKKVESLS